MFLLYEVLLFLVFLVTLPYFLFLGVLRGKYLTNFPARIGLYRSRPEPHDLWVHAVSVGEVLASGPVLAELMRRRPGTSVVLTTTTITGQAQARRLFPSATITYFPLDFTFAVKRFLRHHRPRVFAAMETEIWPNATRLARRSGLRLILANGRISDRSFPRYRAVRGLLRGILRRYDRILVREETDRERFVAIGAPEAVVETTGNVKFDYEPDATPLEIGPVLESLIGNRRVLILGSTREGEDEMLLPEVERFVRESNAFVIIAPRKPERFELVAALLDTTSLRYLRRSEMTTSSFEGRTTNVDGRQRPDVLLVDTVGELAKLYRYATAAFVGGSLAPFGGHNPIEPAAVGVPVCFGPHMTNFREIAGVFLRGEAAQQVDSAAGVIAFAERMFDDERQQRAWSERARRTVQQNRGASARTAQRIVELLA
jgi:3-deoxy-D-manno-octulosonic-acid transferase